MKQPSLGKSKVYQWSNRCCGHLRKAKGITKVVLEGVGFTVEVKVQLRRVRENGNSRLRKQFLIVVDEYQFRNLECT